MRFPLLAYLTVACGCVVAVGGAFAAVHRPLTALALLGAAALAAELIEEPESARAALPPSRRPQNGTVTSWSVVPRLWPATDGGVRGRTTSVYGARASGYRRGALRI